MLLKICLLHICSECRCRCGPGRHSFLLRLISRRPHHLRAVADHKKTNNASGNINHIPFAEIKFRYKDEIIKVKESYK
jgi:hypothetical protein